jgi:hypothetical protein
MKTWAMMRLEADLASRAHCRLEYNRGKFILVDQSTNGTFVCTQDGKEVYLRRPCGVRVSSAWVKPWPTNRIT